MIRIQYLTDCRGAARHGTCTSCGKQSSGDSRMVWVHFWIEGNTGKTTICLCDKCRRDLYEKI